MAAHATVLQAWIDGQVKDSAHLPGTYNTVADPGKSYSIATGASLGNPDAPQDNLLFQNIVITANNISVTGHIYFWADYYPDPTGTVTFKLSASGTITRKVLTVTKAATGSTFSVSGWLQNPTDVSTLPVDPLVGLWSHISYPNNPNPPIYTLNVVCDTVATCGTISYMTPTPGYQQAGVYGPRIMKGEIWFYLPKQNDKLTLNPTSGVSILTSGGGGSGGGTNGDGGGETGGSNCTQCCCSAPCKREPPPDVVTDKFPIDKFIYKQVPVPTLKEYLSEREREEMVPAR
jgi:hypothetical protein